MYLPNSKEKGFQNFKNIVPYIGIIPSSSFKPKCIISMPKRPHLEEILLSVGIIITHHQICRKTSFQYYFTRKVFPTSPLLLSIVISSHRFSPRSLFHSFRKYLRWPKRLLSSNKHQDRSAAKHKAQSADAEMLLFFQPPRLKVTYE